MYFYRANANLRSLGVRGLQHTPGWCAGYWFIPIVSLFKPYQVAAEINAKSLPSGMYDFPCSHVGAWWACWLIGNLLTNIESRLTLNGVDMGGAGLVLSWGSALLVGVAGYLFIRMVFAFAEAQEKMRSSL